MKNTYFQNSLFVKFAKFAKFPYEKLTFFLDKLKQKPFPVYTLRTQGIHHTEFSLIWTSPWSDEKDLFENSLFAKFGNFPMKY